MRKIVAICSTLAIAFLLAGCAQGEAEPTPVDDSKTESVEQNTENDDFSLDATITKVDLTLRYPSSWEMKTRDTGSVNIKPECGGSVMILSPTELQTTIPEYMDESDVDSLFDSYFDSMTKSSSMTITGDGERSFERGIMRSVVPVTATIDEDNADGYCFVAAKGDVLYSVIAAIPHDSEKKYHQVIREIVESIEIE